MPRCRRSPTPLAGDGGALEVTHLDWGGERLLRTGHAMPDDAVEIIRQHDAVLLGAVGHPQLDPDVSVWTLVLPLRKALDLYVNLRPVRSWPGVALRRRATPRASTWWSCARTPRASTPASAAGSTAAPPPRWRPTSPCTRDGRSSACARHAFALARERDADG